MTTPKSFVYLSKLDIAKRELDHAIKLFFSNGDFVVIHLICCSSEEILRVLGKEYDHISFYDQMMEVIKPEKREELLNKINEPFNFMKHASRDKDKTLKFNPESSEFVIWDAINLYQGLTKEITGLMMAFRLWFYSKNKDIVLDEKFKSLMYENAQVIDINNRNLFLELAFEIEKKRLI